MQPLTDEEFKLVLPPAIKKSVNTELMDKINKTLMDEETLESFKENLISYTHVMSQGKFKIDQYINAVKYVSFKLMGLTNKDAYIKTFPEKYLKFIKQGVASKDIASYSTAYNKSKLVNLIYAQTLTPTHVLNAALHQESINIQAEIMRTAKSEKTRSDAAAHLMAHLKPPEAAKMELDVTLKQDETIAALHHTTMELAKKQHELIKNGTHSVKTIAESTLINSEEDIIDV